MYLFNISCMRLLCRGFARRLSLGSLQRKVQNTAMRLIQFMHRDWICIGVSDHPYTYNIDYTHT